MSFRKYGPRALGLSIMAALSLMAFSASVAQADWLENGLLITGLKNFTGKVDLLSVLEVPVLSMEIACHDFDVKKGEILGSNHIELNLAHIELLFEDCDSYGTNPHLLLDGPCELYETVLDRQHSTNQGNLLAKALAQIIADGGKHYILVENIHGILPSRNCLAVPNGTLVTGSLILDLHQDALTNRVEQLITPVNNAALFPNHKLKFGINDAFLLGSVLVKLESGNPWGIC